MGNCTAITWGGGRCRGVAIDGSGLCYSHHPDHAEERRRHGARGGKRGGRGRPTSELADMVLEGSVERADGAVAGQLLNGARACVRDALSAREQEELIERMEQLEAGLQAQKGSRYGA